LKTPSALTVVFAITTISTIALTQAPHATKPTVPRMWDDDAMPTLEVPLANPIGSPKPVSADYYYRIPVRPIYKQYPVYTPGREPAGYMEWLKNRTPSFSGTTPPTNQNSTPKPTSSKPASSSSTPPSSTPPKTKAASPSKTCATPSGTQRTTCP
jgi:hypothetical protein